MTGNAVALFEIIPDLFLWSIGSGQFRGSQFTSLFRCKTMGQRIGGELERFEEFLKVRREMLAQELNEFLEGITETAKTVVQASLEDIIASSDRRDPDRWATIAAWARRGRARGR